MHAGGWHLPEGDWPMRNLVISGALAALTLLAAEPARSQEQEGLWCLRGTIGRGVGERCSFRTFEACRTERSLYGPTAFCSQNPRYLPYWQGRFPYWQGRFGEQPLPQVVRKKKKKYRRY